MYFYLFRYDLRFLKYRHVKKRIIFDRLLSSFSSLARISFSPTYPKLETRRKARFLENIWVTKSIRNFCTVLNVIETLYLYISATDRDIGIKQKMASTTRLSLFLDQVFFFFFTCDMIILEYVLTRELKEFLKINK